jgi:hypothetical protein
VQRTVLVYFPERKLDCLHAIDFSHDKYHEINAIQTPDLEINTGKLAKLSCSSNSNQIKQLLGLTGRIHRLAIPVLTPMLVATVLVTVALLATVRLATVLRLAAIRRRLATVCPPAIPGLASVRRRLSAHVLLLGDAPAWVAAPASGPCLGSVLQAPGIIPQKLRETVHARCITCVNMLA